MESCCWWQYIKKYRNYTVLVMVAECVTAAQLCQHETDFQHFGNFFLYPSSGDYFIRVYFGVVLMWPYFHAVLSKRKLAMEVQKNVWNVICPALKHCLEAALCNPLVFRTSGFQQRILVYLSDYIAVSIFLLPSSRYNFSVGALTPCKFPLSFRGYPAGLTQFMLYILA